VVAELDAHRERVAAGQTRSPKIQADGARLHLAESGTGGGNAL
jgi:hypothetical protein